MAVLIWGMKLASIHSSASSEMTQSPRAKFNARLFCGPNPGQSVVETTRAPWAQASSIVRSVLPLSTTTISSAKLSELRHREIESSSFLVITIKERLGTLFFQTNRETVLLLVARRQLFRCTFARRFDANFLTHLVQITST